MIEFLQHTPAEQRQAFLLTAQKKHLPEPSIEKDWWVTQILNLVVGVKFTNSHIHASVGNDDEGGLSPNPSPEREGVWILAEATAKNQNCEMVGERRASLGKR